MKHIEIDLSKLEPLIALPHSPDNVKTVSELEGTPVDQVCIGSCTNSSLRDLKIVSALLKGKKVHENTSLTVSAGSRQVMAESWLLQANLNPSSNQAQESWKTRVDPASASDKPQQQKPFHYALLTATSKAAAAHKTQKSTLSAPKPQ